MIFMLVIIAHLFTKHYDVYLTTNLLLCRGQVWRVIKNELNIIFYANIKTKGKYTTSVNNEK